MVQFTEKYKKNIAIDMRRKGFSYSEIQNRLSTPKSTLSNWLRDVQITDDYKRKLRERQLAQLRIRVAQEIEGVKESSANDIGKISKREMWLMGIALYWRERLAQKSENDLKRGVRFSSTDPVLLKFFLKWLQDVGGIEKDEILFDIFVSSDMKLKTSDTIAYWSEAVHFPNHFFKHIYFLKRPKRAKGKKEKRKAKGNKGDKGGKESGMEKTVIPTREPFGFLRIRVKASSLLARQIAGWAIGIERQISPTPTKNPTKGSTHDFSEEKDSKEL